MRIPRVYIPDRLVCGTTVTLDERAAGHLIRVLRLQPGAPLILFDGRGGEYHALLESCAKRAAVVRVTEHFARDIESPLQIILGQCIARGSRMDYILQKAVELGVTRVVPLTSERCEVRLGAEKVAGRVQHWEGICIHACEQCGRDRVPDVGVPVPLATWVRQDTGAGALALKLVLDVQGKHRLRGMPPPAGPVILLSGPEGGLTERELALARRCGFVSLGLGPRVLRAETAPVAALTAVQSLWGDLG